MIPYGEMTRKERYERTLRWFEQEMPIAETELHYQNAYQLIVAVILSAQCTDKRVNMITPALFEAFPTPQALAEAKPEQVYEYIKSCSYPNNKTKSLLGMARKLVDEYGGEVPSDIDSLLSLPGVGRKTANVILAVAYELPAMAVDTHVFRVAERIGLTRGSKTPLQTEMTLMKNIPEELAPKAHHWLILHGRYVCKARKPNCEACGLRDFCRYYPVEQKRLQKEAEAKLRKEEERRKQKQKEKLARRKEREKNKKAIGKTPPQH